MEFDFFKKKQKKEDTNRDKYIVCLKKIMAMPEGKQVLITLLNRGNLYKPIVESYNDNDIVYRNAIHDFVTILSSEMMEADIEIYCNFYLKQSFYGNKGKNFS